MNQTTETEQPRTRETLTRHIYGLCNKNAPQLQNEIFAKWFIKAFPDKLPYYIKTGFLDSDYIGEWINRFMTGSPSVHMDKQRLKAYIEVITAWNGSPLKITDTETEKTPVLLDWDDKKGVFFKKILNKAIANETENECFYVAGISTGIYNND
jgi:hypothetical protein